jgi:Mrp family chromosome partitioning ATPase
MLQVIGTGSAGWVPGKIILGIFSKSGTRKMKVAIASGKGGTGKTTVSASLATVWSRPLDVMDLDVEESNLHLLIFNEGDNFHLTLTFGAQQRVDFVDLSNQTSAIASKLPG